MDRGAELRAKRGKERFFGAIGMKGIAVATVAKAMLADCHAALLLEATLANKFAGVFDDAAIAQLADSVEAVAAAAVEEPSL